MKYEGPLEVDAGGILLDGPLHATPSVAVVRRITQKDWSFPKGHVENGETLERAAVREVEEETGYQANLLGLAGAMAYQHDGLTKTVTYFYLLRRDDVPRRTDLDGVDRVDWLSLPAARGRVSYPDLKVFIDRIAGDSWPDPQRPRWIQGEESRVNARRDRINSAIEVYSRELQGLRARPINQQGTEGQATGDEDPAEPWWRQSADELLDLSRRYASQGRIDAAWNALHGSQRLSFHELTPREIGLRAHALKEEVSNKLSGWRKAAALAALSDTEKWPPAGLTEAQELLDQHSNNVYLKLRFAGQRIALSTGLLTLALLLLWLATLLGAFQSLNVHGPFVLRDAGLFAGVVLLGMFGAMLSLALDNASASIVNSRIFEMATTRIAVPVARLAIGAGAAVLTVAAAQALTGGDEPWVLLTAVPAGFSERLVRRSIEALEAATGT